MDEYLSYALAKEFVKKLQLLSYIDWVNYIKGNLPNLPKLPLNIPIKPDKVYKALGWISWEDWLGCGESQDTLTNPIIKIKDNEIQVSSSTLFENISLEKLKIQFQLSVRAYNVCLYNDLTTLQDILQYYSLNKGFKTLRNCGVKTSLELNSLINNLNNYKVANTISYTTGSNENDIIHRSDLSQRAYNCCRTHGLLTRRLLREFLNTHGSFLNLKNCGKNTNLELIDFSKQINNNSDNYRFIKAVLPEIQNNYLFSSEEYFDFLKTNFELPEKSRKLLSRNKITNVYKFFRIIVYPDNRINLLQTELIQFSDYIIKFIWMQDSEIFHGVSESTKQDVLTLSGYLLKNGIIDSESLVKLNIPNAFYSSTFNFLELIHFHTLTYNKRDYEILSNRIFGNFNQCTLAQLGMKLNITRERVRQIETEEERRISRRIRRLLANNQFIIKYLRQEMKLSDYSVITLDTFDEIRIKSQVNFSNKFILFLLVLLNSKTHEIECFKDNLWVAISKKNGFNLRQFKQKLDEIIIDATSNVKRFNFEIFISQLTETTELLHLQDLCNFLKAILAEHYGIYVIDNQVDLANLKKKLNYNDIEEVLREVNRPMKVDEIQECLNNKFIDLRISRTNLLRLIRTDTNIIHIGRTSTFGLLTWEHDRLFKGGTIRDIVFDFLKNKKAPIHISVIEKHVNLYRKTNQRSILTNLKLEKNKRFKFLKGDFIEIQR